MFSYLWFAAVISLFVFVIGITSLMSTMREYGLGRSIIQMAMMLVIIISVTFIGLKLDKNTTQKKIEKQGLENTVVEMYVDNYSIKNIAFYTDTSKLDVVKILKDNDLYK